MGWAHAPSLTSKISKHFFVLLFSAISKMKWPKPEEKKMGIGGFWPRPRGLLLKKILGTPLSTAVVNHCWIIVEISRDAFQPETLQFYIPLEFTPVKMAN